MYGIALIKYVNINEDVCFGKVMEKLMDKIYVSQASLKEIAREINEKFENIGKWV